MKRDEELFQRLTRQGILNEGKNVPSDVIYTAPHGQIKLDRVANKELEEYKVRRATPQTDLLQDAERKFVLPHVMACAPIFRVPPITDDVYRFTNDDMKNEGLFLIISRSYVKKLSGGWLLWDPFAVVIKRMIVARVRCVYHPQDHMFHLKEIHLWQNNTGSYYRIADGRLKWETVPGILEKYVEYEEIFKQNAEGE